MSEDKNSESTAPPSVTFAEFLESVPPNQLRLVTGIISPKSDATMRGGVAHREVAKTELAMHCSSQKCNGVRFFRWWSSAEYLPKEGSRDLFINYLCSNCQRSLKTFALHVRREDGMELEALCTKFGERPAFGPPTPPRLISLIGPDRDEFLQGRRCENQGLGVGAFIYYRRVVENQKNRILGEIVKVAERVGAGAGIVDQLKAAISEVQFSKALAMARNAMPQTLLINGHNPLSLLHGALSDGVHARSDAECLEVASSVRVVLAELSERLGQALKDEAELVQAIDLLLKRSSGEPSAGAPPAQ